MKIRNDIKLTGTLATDWTENLLDSSVSSSRYFVAYITINRAKGGSDTLLIKTKYPFGAKGNRISAIGQVRADIIKPGIFANSLVYVYAESITPPVNDFDVNKVTITGIVANIVGVPMVKLTGDGHSLARMNIFYRTKLTRYMIPVVGWNEYAEKLADNAGKFVTISGRMQSRLFVKNIDGTAHERIFYEVSVSNLEEMTNELTD